MLTLKQVKLLWFAIPFIAVIITILQGPAHYNNYLIYKQVFWHTIQEKNLYLQYPLEYFDTNHYGPFFAVIIAPFALLPNQVGVIFWGVANVSILYIAIVQLPISDESKKIVLLISLIETLTSIQNEQVNPFIAACIILSYILIKKDKLFFAAGLIIAGAMIKLYPIVGIAFIFFSKDRLRFLTYCFLWSILFLILPMLISNFDFIIHSYQNWYCSIIEKNAINISSYLNEGMQDISILGFTRRVTGQYDLSSIYFFLPAALLSLLPLIRLEQLANKSFQLTYLAQILIGVVIFSSSAESSTYVIAISGFAIWYAIQNPKPTLGMNLILLTVLILTILSPTDLFPKYLREKYVIKYALKSLPCALSWIVITSSLLWGQFKYQPNHDQDLSFNTK